MIHYRLRKHFYKKGNKMTKRNYALDKLILEQDEVLILRKCREDLTSHNGFKYPETGFVEALDWQPTTECGNGLHGLVWATGDFNIDDYGNIFQVLLVNKLDGFIDLGDKVKFKRAYVLLTTKEQQRVSDLLMKYVPNADTIKSKMKYLILAVLLSGCATTGKFKEKCQNASSYRVMRSYSYVSVNKRNCTYQNISCDEVCSRCGLA